MIKKTLKTAKKFNAYQRDRFPLIILVLSLIPAILSSGAIMSAHSTILQMSYALIASVAYLLHIRIIDEHRDFGHDNVHHTERPVQIGVISKEELRYIDILAILILISIAVVAGQQAFIVVIVMLAYSYLAGKEFFCGEKIRQHFFTYNAVNLVQMLLMQIFVYTVFTNPFPFTKLIFVHFLFTSVGTIIFEFVRKLKRPGHDGSGRDTYTWYLGFNRAVAIFLVLVLLNTLLFFWIAILLSTQAIVSVTVALGLAGLVALAALIHARQKTHTTDQAMQLSFPLAYGVFNIAIYFFIIH